MANNVNRVRIRAFFQEFPFLSKIGKVISFYDSADCRMPNCNEFRRHTHMVFLNQNEVVKTNVSRISTDFLQTRAWYRDNPDSLSDPSEDTSIYLLDSDGKILTQVDKSIDIKYEWDFGHFYKESETVGEALMRLDDPRQVIYVIAILMSLNGDEAWGDRPEGLYITVYKPPKGFTLSAWVEEQMRREKARLHSDLSKIDSEA